MLRNRLFRRPLRPPQVIALCALAGLLGVGITVVVVGLITREPVPPKYDPAFVDWATQAEFAARNYVNSLDPPNTKALEVVVVKPRGFKPGSRYPQDIRVEGTFQGVEVLGPYGQGYLLEYGFIIQVRVATASGPATVTSFDRVHPELLPSRNPERRAR